MNRLSPLSTAAHKFKETASSIVILLSIVLQYTYLVPFIPVRTPFLTACSDTETATQKYLHSLDIARPPS